MTRDLASVLDAILEGVLVLDATAQVEQLNAEACRILETSGEAAVGQPLSGLLGGDHPVVNLAHAVLASGRPAVEHEHAIERRLDEAVMVDISGSPLLGRDRKPVGVVLVLIDRTIHDSLRSFVSERETLETFGRIAAGIAHEVKNPLGGIRGAAELLAARSDDEKTQRSAALIVREVARIAKLVDDMLVFTHSEDIAFEPINVHRVLDDVLDLLAMDPIGARALVRRRFDPSIPELPADAARLTQVFLNLARNALQAMEGDERTLVIVTRMTLDHRLSSPSGQPVPTVLVEFCDSGPGIAPEVLDQLATPFFTTRFGGTGLGLAVSRHWVSRHGGTLRIESTPGKGTTARVALPLRRPK